MAFFGKNVFIAGDFSNGVVVGGEYHAMDDSAESKARTYGAAVASLPENMRHDLLATYEASNNFDGLDESARKSVVAILREAAGMNRC